jgi:tetratricopeptide (TPR) repeat protein
MRRVLGFSVWVILALTTGGSEALRAQQSPGGLVGTVLCSSFKADSPSPFGYDETLDLGIQALNLGRVERDKDTRKCLYKMAEAFSRHLLFENPNDPLPRQVYSLAMGLRSREEGARTSVRLAQRSFEEAQLLLTVEPDHPGAQHIMGRLFSHAMRLNGFKRFVATRILGAKAMSEASWEEAESLLAAAARLQPELPDHHFQLGVLYLATDRPELALAAYERVLLCEAVYPADFDLLADAERMVERLRSELESSNPGAPDPELEPAEIPS